MIKLNLTSSEAVILLNAVSNYEDGFKLSGDLASDIIRDCCKSIRHKVFDPDSTRSVYVVEFEVDGTTSGIIGVYTSKEMALDIAKSRAILESSKSGHAVHTEEFKSNSESISDWVEFSVDNLAWSVSENKLVEGV